MAAYADDIIIMGETEDQVRDTAKRLIEEGKIIGLNINEDKTKYLIVSRGQYHQNSILMRDMTFEKIHNFKYLGVDVNERANSHEEINRRMIAGNKCYFSLVPLFKSKLLSRRTKVGLYKTLIRPVVLYAYGARALTKKDEKKLITFERKY